MATKSTENVRRTYGVQTDHYGQDIRNSSSDTLSVTKDRTIVRFRRIAETSLINNNSSTKSAPHNGSPSYSRNILTETEGYLWCRSHKCGHDQESNISSYFRFWRLFTKDRRARHHYHTKRGFGVAPVWPSVWPGKG